MPPVSGPRGLPLVGHLPALSRDPLQFFRECTRKYGPVARFKVLHYDVYLLTEPSLIQEVLQTKASSFLKSADYRNLQTVFGNGLLTAEGPAWLHQRRMLQPAFHHTQLDRYAETMSGCAQAAVATWKAGEIRDIHQDMMRITLQIVARTLFNTEAPAQIDLVSDAVSAVFQDLSAASMFIPFLRRLPTRRNQRWNRAAAQLDQIIYGLIDETRARLPDAGEGLTEMLIRARSEDETALDNRQIRDELMTMFLAGHETTAVALSWTLYLLSQHPAIEDKLCEEIDNFRAQQPADYRQGGVLPYTRAVIQESMRLYPPVWTIGREARTDVELGGVYVLPKGAQVWICQWIVHHDERLFPSADRFQPERWLGEAATSHARFRYLPFGNGPRVCIGQGFAMLEALIILARILSRFRLRLQPGFPVEPSPWFTLRPKHGLQMRVEPRN